MGVLDISFHLRQGGGGAFSRSLGTPTYFFLYQIGPVANTTQQANARSKETRQAEAQPASSKKPKKTRTGPRLPKWPIEGLSTQGAERARGHGRHGCLDGGNSSGGSAERRPKDESRGDLSKLYRGAASDRSKNELNSTAPWLSGLVSRTRGVGWKELWERNDRGMVQKSKALPEVFSTKYTPQTSGRIDQVWVVGGQ